MPPHAAAIESTTSISRGDPLAHYLARRHIGQAQYLAGRKFRELYAAEGQAELAKSYRALGADGTAVVHDMLIRAMSSKEVAASRGLTGKDWDRYYARRFFEALSCLAVWIHPECFTRRSPPPPP